MSSCYWSIEQLPGISNQQVSQLHNHQIYNTKDILLKANTKQKQQYLANQMQLNVKYIAKWFALADLARIKSVGCDYCGLLLHAGVGSVRQLITIPVAQLHRRILRLQVATMQRKDLCPSISLIKTWIKEGKSVVLAE